MASSILDKFCTFHEENPHVYDELVKLAREAKQAGVDRWSINGLFEVLRWNSALKTSGDTFKLNNTYRAFYARVIMAVEPELEGFFEVREAQA